MICGFVLGDVSTAMKIGATIQPMFLAFTGAGGTVVWDETAATMGGCVITMISGLDTSQAVKMCIRDSLMRQSLENGQTDNQRADKKAYHRHSNSDNAG